MLWLKCFWALEWAVIQATAHHPDQQGELKQRQTYISCILSGFRLKSLNHPTFTQLLFQCWPHGADSGYKYWMEEPIRGLILILHNDKQSRNTLFLFCPIREKNLIQPCWDWNIWEPCSVTASHTANKGTSCNMGAIWAALLSYNNSICALKPYSSELSSLFKVIPTCYVIWNNKNMNIHYHEQKVCPCDIISS